MLEKKVILKLLYFHSFVGICDIYLENSLLNFHFGFDIENTIPVYIPSSLAKVTIRFPPLPLADLGKFF